MMKEELEDLFGRSVDLVEKAGLRNPFRRHAILKQLEPLIPPLPPDPGA